MASVQQRKVAKRLRRAVGSGPVVEAAAVSLQYALCCAKKKKKKAAAMVRLHKKKKAAVRLQCAFRRTQARAAIKALLVVRLHGIG